MEQNARVKLLLSSYYLEAYICLKSDKLDLFSQTPAISVFSHVIFHFVLPKGMPDNAQGPDCSASFHSSDSLASLPAWLKSLVTIEYPLKALFQIPQHNALSVFLY